MSNVRKVYILLTLAAVAVPFLVKSEHWLSLAVIAMTTAVLALACNMCLGYLGLLNMCYTALYGLGGYATALATTRLGVSSWLGLLFALAVAGVISLIIGLSSLRLKGPFFVLLTMAFFAIVGALSMSMSDITGGPAGVRGIPYANVGFELATTFQFYFLMLIVLVLSIYIVYRLIHSRVGRALVAVRDNENLAGSLGIKPYHYKLLAFVVSGLLAALAGWTHAHFITLVDPTMLGVSVLFDSLFAVVVGGSGTIAGPVIGAFFVTLVPEAMNALPIARIESIRYMIFAALMLVVVLRFPQGLWGYVQARVGLSKTIASRSAVPLEEHRDVGKAPSSAAIR